MKRKLYLQPITKILSIDVSGDVCDIYLPVSEVAYGPGIDPIFPPSDPDDY